MWTVRVFTLYPELFPGPLGIGLYKKALKKKLWSLEVVNAGDANGAKEIIHDDFKFLMHASGKTLSKDDVVKWVGTKDVKLDKERILFENNEVGFMHAIASFKDGNKEAVMSYYKFKDGKIAHQETGATKLTK